MASLNESLFNTPNAKRLMTKYGKTLAVTESVRKNRGFETTMERKLLTAQTIDNTKNMIRVMESYNAGATQPSSIGAYKRYSIDMVAAFTASTISPEIVSTQSIDNRVGMINILQFQYGSDKGAAKNGETFASALGYQGMNAEYSSSEVTGETLTAISGTYTLAFTPVIPETLVIRDLSGAVVSGVTVDAESGILTDQGSVLADGFTADYRYDNETVPVKAPLLKMDIKSLPITTQSRKLAAVWSFDAAYELSKEYGEDMQSLLATQAAAEITQEIDREICADLYRIASAGPEVRWSRTAPTGVSVADHFDSFWTEIVKGSNEIFEATRRCRANFMVCGLNVDAVLKCMRGFDANEDMTAIGPHFIGTLGGVIKCYVNPNYEADTFVLGYKGPNMIDAGYVYAPYLPIATTQMVTLEDFASRQGWATIYGKKAINPRLYVKGRIIG